MNRRILYAMFIVLLITQVVLSQEAEKKSEQEGINWSKGIDLYTVTMWIQKETGKKFLFADESIKARKVYFVSREEIAKPEDKFAVFQSILQISGFVLSKVGEGDIEIYKIITIEKGPSHPTEYVTGDEKRRLEDKYVTRLFTLKYIIARDVSTALMNLVTQPKGLFPIDSAGMLLITDYDYNIDKFDKIITAMDVKKPDIEMQMLQLKNSLATDVEQMLNNLVQTLIQRAAGTPRPGFPAGSQEQVKIVADKRTNSIVILADPSRMEQIKELVARLDGEVGFETSGIHIYHLKYVNADETARTLASTYSVSASGVRPGGATVTPAAGQPSLAASPGAAPPVIVADSSSNSIIIVTDRNTYKNIEELIGKLDRRKSQVLIKASIVEIRGNDTFDLGVELATIDQPGNSVRGFAATGFQLTTLVDTDGDSIPDSRIPIQTPGTSAGIIMGLFKNNVGNIPAVLKALKTENKINILSEPEAVANDNQLAKLTVKDQVPVITTTNTTSAISTTSFGGFQDAGTTLIITPHVSENQQLRLEIDVTIEKFAKQSANAAIPPPKTSRQLTTSIFVPNARTVVIGGLVVQDETEGVDSVPIAGDIPIIGEVFKKRSNTTEKRTLYLFVTPYILYDEKFGDYKEMTRERKEAADKLRDKPLDLKIDDPAPPEPYTNGKHRLPDEPSKKE